MSEQNKMKGEYGHEILQFVPRESSNPEVEQTLPAIFVIVNGNDYRVEAINMDGTVRASFDENNFATAIIRAGILMNEYTGNYTVEWE